MESNFRFNLCENKKFLLLVTDLRISEPVQKAINLPVPGTLRISCEYTGPKDDHVLWSKNFVRMGNLDGFVRSSTEQLSGGRVTITDTITKETTEFLDSGNYTCYVPNSTLSDTLTVHASKYKELRP